MSSPFAGRDPTPPLDHFATDVDNMSLQNTDPSAALNLISNPITTNESVIDDNSLDEIVEAEEKDGDQVGNSKHSRHRP